MAINIAPSIDEDDLRHRLPEAFLIADTEIRETTVNAFVNYCPDYFWERPASKFHHHPQHREKHGLWLHTKRAFSAYDGLIDTEVAHGRVTATEREAGRAAILLHDLFKYGWNPVQNHTTGDHGALAADILSANTPLPDRTIECINTHEDKWGGPGMAETGGDPLLHSHHVADWMGSRKRLPLPIHPRVHPDLTAQFEDLLTTSYNIGESTTSERYQPVAADGGRRRSLEEISSDPYWPF